MILKRLLAFVFVFVVHNAYANDSLSLASPSHVIEVNIYHQPDGQVQYGVYYKRKLFIKPSGLAIRLKNPDVLLNKFDLVKSGQREFNETWKPVWGEVGSIKNNYQELTLQFKDKSGSGILLNIIFRAFDDGIGFRYEFPQQEKLNHFIVADEMTQFSLGADHTVFWIPGDFDTNEFKYNHTKLSEVDASSSAMSQEIAAKTFFDKNAVQTPLMIKTADGLYINIHEAALVNYPAMDTANVKKYIDFAAKYGFDGVLVEGWNTGWEDWFGEWKENVFDFVTPYPDYNIDELTAYAKSKGVKIICHHETSASVTNYERWMDTAYRFMINHNMNSVKTGYVGRIIPRGEHHDGQWMINHYVRVADKTASYKIMVDMHEPVRPTGLQRTYPNWLACEAARGNEFNAWSVGNPPEHETILPFTRLMGGPMDYTPGLFRIKLNQFSPDKKEQIHTTLTKQLALYVTMYSPLQMAADLPENYEAHPDALQFIRDVAVDWDDTKILDAEPGDYIIEARKAKTRPGDQIGRRKDSWFLGAITDENARSFTETLSFLDANKKYVATVYHDADDADWKNNPEAYKIEKFIVDSQTKLNLKLAPGGGTAISLMPANADEVKQIKKYK